MNPTKNFTRIISLILVVILALAAIGPAFASPTRIGPILNKPIDRLLARGWPFHGDRLLARALGVATMEATGLTAAEIRAGLRAGKSLVEIASAVGTSQEEILSIFDQHAAIFFSRAVESGRLPQKLADARLDWFKSAARQMLAQPGLRPAYPGLHELHLVAIQAAVRVGELDRDQVRDALHECSTLDAILTANGHTSQEVVEAAMSRIDSSLDRLVETNKLSAALRQSWSAGIRQALERMMTTPGLHLAGKECAQ